MFGYVKACPPQLRLCEWEAYRGVYCGLCRTLGRRFGPFARLTLSYDFTFLAMLSMALGEEPPAFRRRRCGVNPLHRCQHCEENASLQMSCDIAVLTLWYKVEDNIADSGFLARCGWRLLRGLMRRQYCRTAVAYPALDAVFADQTQRQRRLEQQETAPPLDELCEPTACMMQAMLGFLGGEAAQQRILERLGYLLGRYIYMADALDDWEKDQKSGSFNPFLQTGGEAEALRRRAKESLNLTIGEIGATFDLLTLQRFQPVLENIIHLGLSTTVEELQLPPKQRRKRYP